MDYCTSQERRYVAVVDDEESIRTNIEYSLCKEGYRCQCFSHGEEAWAAFQNSMPDLIILDVMMPRMDGLELCRRIRGMDTQTPILFLSSRDEEIDRILGLEMGGDDYLCKPFSLRELMVRVKVHFRRQMVEPQEQSHEALNWGDLELDKTSCRVRWKGDLMAVTLTEFRILESLLLIPGAVKSREQLMRAAFPEDSYVSDRAADSHIKRLRKKMNHHTGDQGLIETVYGMGYRIREI